jgi:hypothetical protein
MGIEMKNNAYRIWKGVKEAFVRALYLFNVTRSFSDSNEPLVGRGIKRVTFEAFTQDVCLCELLFWWFGDWRGDVGFVVLKIRCAWLDGCGSLRLLLSVLGGK